MLQIEIEDNSNNKLTFNTTAINTLFKNQNINKSKTVSHS